MCRKAQRRSRPQNAAGMDYSDNYELDVKAGNRLGRRLRASVGRIGQAVRGVGQRVEPFDPNAFDGDGDGIVQDGSQWERPVAATAQVAPQAFVPQTQEGEPDVANQIAQSLAPDTRPQGGQGARVPASPQRGGVATLRSAPEVPTPEVAAAPRAAAKRDLRERDAYADMTPREIAEAVVPASVEEFLQRSVDTIVGHPDQYETLQDYENARELVEARARERIDDAMTSHEVMRQVYDAKHGTGAFDRDVYNDRRKFRTRLQEVIGSSATHFMFLATQPRTLVRGTDTERFLNEISADPDTTPEKRRFYQELLALHPQEKDPHQIWTDVFHNSGQTIVAGPDVSRLQRILGGFLIGDAHPNVYGVELRVKKHILDEQYGKGIYANVTNADLVKMVLNDYWNWAAKRSSVRAMRVRRQDGIDGLPTEEQVNARVDMARGAMNIGRAVPFLFPGQISVAINDAGNGLELREMVRYNGAENEVFDRVSPSFDPEDVEKMRYLVQKMLEENPAVLRQWRRFGGPSISYLHPLSSPPAMYVEGRIPLSLLTGEKTNASRRALEQWKERLRKAPFTAWFRGRSSDEKTLFGVSRSSNGFIQNLFGGNADAINYADTLDDVTVTMGTRGVMHVGGFYQNDIGSIFVDPFVSDIAWAEGDRVGADIIQLAKADSTVSLGPTGTVLHEWTHHFHDRVRHEAREILNERAEQRYADNVANGMPQREARKEANKWYKDTMKTYGLLAGMDRGKTSVASMLNNESNRLLGKPLFDENNPFDKRTSLPKGRRVYDYSRYAEYGFGSQDEMKDFVLQSLLELKDDGYRRGEILGFVNEVDPNDPLLIAGLTTRLMAELGRMPTQKELEKALEDIIERRREAAGLAAKTSPEPYVRSRYGQTTWIERYPEAVVGALMESLRKRPFFVNDAMVRLIQNLFMERDENGPLVEKHGITRLLRRKRGQGRDEFTTQTEDISDNITSTEQVIIPEEVRQPDGHRGQTTVRSGGRMAPTSLRFDPDERSRLRSGRSNIGLDTDERLYAFEDPITVSDFRARARVMSIGDHRFYDTGIPYAQAAGFRRRATLGYIAGRKYVNRNRPHQGDMIRAVSSVQFGLFVDDMPVYDTTTDADRQMLRGLVSGRVAKLPTGLRQRVEEALKDATHIHSAISGAERSKQDMYRVVKVDPATFAAGMVPGERIPMPITAFTRLRPSQEPGQVVIRVEKGAKAIDVDDNQLLSQGTFEIMSVEDNDGQIVANLKHVETYDPRHDAMRPVDRFSDKPGAMRKMGTPFARYSRAEQERMEADLASRSEMTQAKANEYSALRSSGQSGLGIEIDREISGLVDKDVLDGAPVSRRTESARAIIAALRGKISSELREQAERRLDIARDAMTAKYGNETPWKDDADTVRRYVAIEPTQVNQFFMRVRETVLAALKDEENDFGLRNDDDVLNVARPAGMQARERAAQGLQYTAYMNVSKRQLQKLLDTGLYDVRDQYSSRQDQVVGQIPILLNPDERNMLTSIVGMMDVADRAYLMDNGEQTIDIARGELLVRQDEVGGEPHTTLSFQTIGRMGDDSRFSIEIGGKVFHRDGGRDSVGGFFRRSLHVTDGQLVVNHSNMNLSQMENNLGAATVINQHSWQWWRQVPGTRVVLTAAMDGPIVWPRHGFHPKDGGSRRMDFDENGVDFGKLIEAVTQVLLRTSNDKDVRAKSKPKDPLHDGLIQARIDKEGNIRRSPSERVVALVLGRQQDDEILELSESDKRLRERLALWLSLAVEDRFRTTEDRRATLVLLANLLDTKNMTATQRGAWKRLFTEAYHGDYALELDGIDNDPDYLPSFVISDGDPTGGRIERMELIRRERETGGKQDMFLPQPEDPAIMQAMREEEDVEFSLENANSKTIEKAMSRLQRVYDMAGEMEGDIRTNEVRIARDIAGYDALPRVMTPDEAPSTLGLARNFRKLQVGPWRNGKKSQDKRMIIVGIPQNARKSMDEGLITDSIRNFLRGNRGGMWDTRDNTFLGGQFTTTPGEFAGRFASWDNPMDDPATNKYGILAVTSSWARWTSRDELSETSDIFDTMIQDMMPEELPIPAGQTEFRPYNIPDVLSTVEIDDVPLYREQEIDGAWAWVLDTDVLKRYIAENHPDLSYEQENDIATLFAFIGNMRTMLNTSNESRRSQVRQLASWMFDLTTTNTNDSDDSRARMTLATILGYDILDETKEGEVASRIEVLNRQAVRAVDEAVSLSDISELAGLPVTPSDSRRSLRSAGISSSMYGDGAPSLLRVHLESEPDPIILNRGQIRSHSYQRLVRQDFGVDLPRPTLRSKDRELSDRYQEHYKKRPDNRNGSYELSTTETRPEYKKSVNDRVAEYKDLESQVEAIDDEITMLFEEWEEKDDAGQVTREYQSDYDKRMDALEDKKTALEIRQEQIVDTFAKEVETLNNVIDVALSRSGMVRALEAFLADEASLDIPDEYKERVRNLLGEINGMTDIPSLDDIKWRHKILTDMLDDEFDIRWEVEKDRNDDRSPFEGVTLEDVDWDDVDESPTDDWLEWVYRGFFDPNFEQWRDGRASRIFDPWIKRMEELGMPAVEKSGKRRVQDMFDAVVDGITTEQRREWSARHDEFLDDEYNAEYEESLIDATPASSTPKPNGVPDNVWRKVRAAARLAQKSPYEGERRNANDSAKRLLEQHRPDLANDQFVSTLRSSGRKTLPTMKGVNLYSTGAVTRGALPERPVTPRNERYRPALVQALKDKGIDISEADMLPDGRYGRHLQDIFANDVALSPDMIIEAIDATDKKPREYVYLEIPDEDKPVLREIITESAKLSMRSGLGLTEIPGHSIKKINGPVDTEIADVLMDEVDMTLIRNLGAPTYEMFSKIAASFYTELARLNKVFGAYESRDEDGNVSRVGSGFFFRRAVDTSSAYMMFLDFPDVEEKGGSFVYKDIRGLAVMSIKKDAIRGKSNVRELLDGTAIGSSYQQKLTKTRTNDAIVEAMLEAVGADYDIRAGRSRDDAGGEGGKSLSALREQRDAFAKMVETMEFSPTPAGRHMQQQFSDRIQSFEQQIDLIEKIGRRYVHLIKDSGVSQEDLPNRVKELVNQLSATDNVFTNGSATNSSARGMTMLEQALSAHMVMQLASPMVPRITDVDVRNSGLHEIGHFTLGQGFTRHGEFTANIWPFLVYGRHMWSTFARTQQSQTERFDLMTLGDNFGRKMSKEQIGVFRGLSADSMMALISSGLVSESRTHVALRRRDAAKMVDDIVENVNADTRLGDIEKAEIVTAIRESFDNDRSNIFSKSLYNQYYVANADEAREKLESAMAKDLTPEVLETLGIPNPITSPDDPDGYMSVSLFRMYDESVPLDPALFGWRRGSNNAPNMEERDEFVSLLRFAQETMGGSPRTFGDESDKEMAELSSRYNERRRSAKRKLAEILAALDEMAKNNPSLREEFGEQLKGLK